MSQKDLSVDFVSALNKSVTNKKELVYMIADILNIEPGAVYRRLAGTARFSIYEMGVIARQMNISLDSLLNEDPERTPFFLHLGAKSSPFNMRGLIMHLEEIIRHWDGIESRDVNTGAIFASLPVEFFMHHPHLCKYMYFKWGRQFVATKEFDNFSQWEVPAELIETHHKLNYKYRSLSNGIYFWDISLLPNLITEINYHILIGLLTREEASSIKSDLHLMLENFEEFVKGREGRLSPLNEAQFECYTTNISVGVSSYYVICDSSYMSVISSSFLYSSIHYDRETAIKIYKWINSTKKISSLISGGCEKERILFFRRQHQLVDTIVTSAP